MRVRGLWFLMLVLAVYCAGDNGAWDFDMEDYKDHPCNRQCRDDDPPRICKYKFIVENYFVLSKACYNCPYNQSHCFLPHCVPADGVRRAIKVVNRMMPGPSIQVCEGDTVEVKVENRLDAGETLSIHWHGILQKGTPHMDGVSLVTQCPVTFASKFTYRFVAKDPGTHYWHGHSGVQRSDGMYGPFIVRQPPSRESHVAVYDHDMSEHVLTVMDWTTDMTTNRFAKYVHYDMDNKPELMLINGKGQYKEYSDSSSNSSFFTPHATFTVSPGKKYRFRVISNGIMNCATQFSIDQHTMIVIALDGKPIEPFVTDSITFYSGERIDFVLYADKTQSLRNYWIRARGINNCAVHKAKQTAILKYQGAPDILPPENITWEDGNRGGISLNSAIVNKTPDSFEIADMISSAPDDDNMTAKPDKKFYLAIDFVIVENLISHNPLYYPVNSSNRFLSPQVNWITSHLPPSPPLTQLRDLNKDMFCNAETVQKQCKKEWCACVHLYEVALGDLVEIIIVDEGTLSHAYHPMHLHGHSFRVLGMGRLNESTTLDVVKELDRQGELNRTTFKAPIKDTIIVPDGGYTILRFRADNPGFWLLHCHVEFHAESGMALAFQVGTPSQHPPPPKNFHTCGDWDHTDSQESTTQTDETSSIKKTTESNKSSVPAVEMPFFSFVTFVVVIFLSSSSLPVASLEA